MALDTKQYTLDHTAWTDISGGASKVLIRCKNDVDILYHGAAVEPVDLDAPAFTLEYADKGVGLNNFSGTIYARRRSQSGDPATIVVMSE